jgi:ribonuclease Z
VELYFLGTGAGVPTRQRNVTSVALNLMQERSTVWLFDVGEGTQHQMLKSPLKPSRLESIFITHLHGDHLFGLPGLLTSRSHQGGEQPMFIFGPPGIKKFVDTALNISGSHLEYELKIVEINEGTIFEDHQFRVIAAKLEHRIDSYGYRIEEKNIPGALDVERLRREGIQPGPNYALLKRGDSITLEDGRIFQGKDYVGPTLHGRKVVIFGDTRSCQQEIELAIDADVIVHESTYMHDKVSNATQYFHSTATQVAELALKANVKTLILTHLSSRYQDESVHLLLEEARSIFPNVHVAEDFWHYPVFRQEL